MNFVGGARRAAGRASVGRVQRVMLWVAAVRRRHTRNSRGAQVAPSRHPDARGATSAPNNGNTVSVGVNPAANEEPGERSPDLQWQEYARDQHANRGVEVNSIQCMICLQNVRVGAEDHFITPCYHHYHRQCIVTWLETKNTCPICKREQHLLTE